MIPTHFPLRRFRISLSAIGALVSALLLVRPALADDTWTGQGSDSNWSTGGNWDGGAPNKTYGVLYFNDNNNGKTTNTDDIASLAQNGLRWYDDQSWTIDSSSASNIINLYDNGGTQSEIQNFSTGQVTINVAITFAANNSRSGANSNPFGQIDAINGDLTFGAAGTLTVGGPSSTVDGLRLFGGSAFTTTFNNAVNASNATNGGVGDKYVALVGQVANGTGTGTNVTIGGTFNSGDIYVMDGSTLNLGSGGTINTTTMRLGGDFGATGYQNLASGGTFNLTSTTGGQAFAGTISTISGNTSGALRINSRNTSGTNTLSGGIYLDSPLTISAASAGGTLALTGPVDIKSQTLTISGAGIVNVADGIQSSAGGGDVSYVGTGTLLLNGTGNNLGTVDINSGTLGGTGSVAGPVNINTGGIIRPGNIDPAGTATPGRLTVGALTLASTSTSVFDLATNSAYGSVVSGGTISLAGSLVVNVTGSFPNGTVFDLAHGASLTGTYNGIVDNGVYAFGGMQFEAEYTGTDFDLVVVPEPGTGLAGVLLLGFLGVTYRRRWLDLWRMTFATWTV